MTPIPRSALFPRYATAEERILRNIEVAEDGCWHWTSTINERGYGAHCWRRNGRNQFWPAHRLSYTLFVAPILARAEIDHLCHTNDPTCAGGRTCLHRRCVRPDHLEAVTRVANLRRAPLVLSTINAAKTHCKRGHPFDERNTRVRRGRRECRACAALYKQRR